MFEFNPYYRNYQKYNDLRYGYTNPRYYTQSYSPTPSTMYNYFTEPMNNYHKNIADNILNSDSDTSNNHADNPNRFYEHNNESNENSKSKNFRLGPLQIEDSSINVFGFSIAIDDLIIIGLMILLFFQSDRDYTLLIVLGLMLFNITFSNLDFFRGL